VIAWVIVIVEVARHRLFADASVTVPLWAMVVAFSSESAAAMFDFAPSLPVP